MTELQWMKVYALWQRRVDDRRYLADVEPYNLCPVELERLIVDGIYCDETVTRPIDKSDFRKLKGCLFGFKPFQVEAIKMHLPEPE